MNNHFVDFGGAKVSSMTTNTITFDTTPSKVLPSAYPFKMSVWRAKQFLANEDVSRQIITITGHQSGNTYSYTRFGEQVQLLSGEYWAFIVADANFFNKSIADISENNSGDLVLTKTDGTTEVVPIDKGIIISNTVSTSGGETNVASSALGDTIIFNFTGNYTHTVNLPAVTSANNNSKLVIYKSGAGTLTIDANGSATIDGSATQTLGGNPDTVTLAVYGSNWIVVSKDTDTNVDVSGKADKDLSNVDSDLTDTEKSTFRSKVGAGTSDFSGNYADLAGKPTIPVDTDIYEGAWDAATTYDIAKLVSRSGAFYLSKQASNLNHDPATDTNETWWEKIGVGSPDDVVSVTKSGDIVTITDRDNSTTTFSLSDYVNPLNISKAFRTEDGSNANNAGLIFFIKSDNSQWQSGSSNQIAAVEINDEQYTLSQNPQTDNASYTGWHKFLDDMIENEGSTIWTFQRIDETNPDTTLTGQVFRLQAENIIKNTDGNYVLQNIVPLVDYNTSGSGYSWQVIGAFAPPSGADAIVGKIDIDTQTKGDLPLNRVTGTDDLVKKRDLEGKEEDRYASYTNGFIGSGYRTGSICLFTNSSGAPTTATAIRQPDITDGAGTIAFGKKLRTDRDPNANFALDDGTQQFNNGDVVYISIWNDKSAHLKATLTSDATTLDTGANAGDAAYRYYTANWDAVNDLPDVVDYGDYMHIADYEPTDLDIKIPASDVIGGKDKLDLDGANATGTTDIAQTSQVPVKTPTGDYENKSVAHLSEHVRPQTTAPRYITLTWETTSDDINDGNSKVGWQNTIDPNTNIGQLKISFPDPVPLQGGGSISIADLKAILNAHHRLDLYSGSTIIKGSITNFFTSFGEYFVNIQNATQSALPTDGLSMTLKLESNIPNRDEIADQAFLDNDPNISR